jgi:hypothetical protein
MKESGEKREELFTQYTVHSTQYTGHSTQDTQYTVHSTSYIGHRTCPNQKAVSSVHRSAVCRVWLSPNLPSTDCGRVGRKRIELLRCHAEELLQVVFSLIFELPINQLKNNNKAQSEKQ